MSDYKVLYICAAVVALAGIFTIHSCIVDSAQRCAARGGYYDANTAKCEGIQKARAGVQPEEMR